MTEENKGFSGDLEENDTVKEYYVKRASKVAEHVANRFGFRFDLAENTEKKGGDSQ